MDIKEVINHKKRQLRAEYEKEQVDFKVITRLKASISRHKDQMRKRNRKKWRKKGKRKFRKR